MKTKLIISLSFFLLFTSTLAFSQNNYPEPYAPLTTKAFADSLFYDGFYSEAESEYKRFLFSIPQVSFSDKEVLDDILSSVLSLNHIYKTQQNKQGITWLKDFFYNGDRLTSDFYNGDRLTCKEKLNLVYGNFIFLENNPLQFKDFAISLNPELNTFSSDFQNLISISQLVLDKKISQLSLLTTQISQESDTFSQINQLCTDFKTKKAGVALCLSAILPGSGKWYTGSYPAFISSLISIGTFATGTVLTGIKTEWKSWQPYVFGSCGLILYITDLYGSYQSALRYNEAQYRKLYEETKNIYEQLYEN